MLNAGSSQNKSNKNNFLQSAVGLQQRMIKYRIFQKLLTIKLLMFMKNNFCHQIILAIVKVGINSCSKIAKKLNSLSILET